MRKELLLKEFLFSGERLWGAKVKGYGVLCFLIDPLFAIKINFIRGFGALGWIKPRGKHGSIIFRSGFNEDFSAIDPERP